MSNALLISVRLHEGWYHGFGNTPSPARMFQALVAGAGLSGPLDEEAISSLKWLERQTPPIVAVPSTTRGQTVVNYVPNNDLDSKQGDHRRIGDIRVKKLVSPLLFDPEIPFLFAWQLTDDSTSETVDGIRRLAERVYQLGRTVDMAWAWGEVLSSEELHSRLSSYPGIVRHPSPGTGNVDCPTPGSLESLDRRYAAASQRFDRTGDGKGQTFRRRPKPKWKKVCFEGIASRLLLELRRSDDTGFAPWPLEHASILVKILRDNAAEKLRTALGDRISDIDRTLIGRKPNGDNDGPASARVRVIPLPSIGHEQADMQIRRILVDIPGECPIRTDDISWAVSGLQLNHPVSQEAIDVICSGAQGQLKYFGVNKPSKIWRSVTPVVLLDAARRRIDPNRRQAETKSGQERYLEQVTASFGVAQALRHAGIDTEVTSVRAQREPFDLRGTRAEPFSEGTRFNKHALWHLEIKFENPISGPLIIGNGRFLGLGLMRPFHQTHGLFAFSIDSGLNSTFEPTHLARSLRRAVMARIQTEYGRDRIPSYFSGHQSDGSPARSKPHLTFLFDPDLARLMVVAPHSADHRSQWKSEEEYLDILSHALCGFRELRAGKAGLLRLTPITVDQDCDHIFGTSRSWKSVTPYCVNRHGKRQQATEILRHDVVNECERRGLPRPEVFVDDWHSMSGQGLFGHLRLKFKQHLSGPISLGRNRFHGGGLFRVTSDQA